MNATTTGLLVGILLAIAATTGGLGGFLLAVILGVVGFGVAGHLSGELDLARMWRARERE